MSVLGVWKNIQCLRVYFTPAAHSTQHITHSTRHTVHIRHGSVSKILEEEVNTQTLHSANPPIQQNWHKFWTHDAIWTTLRSLNVRSLYNIVYFTTVRAWQRLVFVKDSYQTPESFSGDHSLLRRLGEPTARQHDYRAFQNFTVVSSGEWDWPFPARGRPK